MASNTQLAPTIIRFGGLIGPGRNPASFFSGKTNIPNGQAPVNMIHRVDCVGIVEQVIRQQCFGITINACAPDHPPKARFYMDMAKKAGRLPPCFIDELLDWKIVHSNFVSDGLGYKYLVGNWDNYPLQDLLQ